MGPDAQEQTALLSDGEVQRDKCFRVFADQIAPKKRPTNTETSPVAPQTSEQPLVCDAVVCTLTRVEEASSKLVLETHIA